MYTSNKHPRLVDVTDVYLWYCRLGHINKNKMNRLAQEEILDDNDYKSLPIYESCLFWKMIKSFFIEKSERASDILGLVYTDVYGPMSTSAKRRYQYFITFTRPF